MNYFGHAAIATLRGEDTAFVLGAMLPDLCAMTRISEVPFAQERIRAGTEFHVRTDAVFHQCPTFLRLNAMALSQLGKRNIRRGPARAAAHIGVEMLIDAELTQRDDLFGGYGDALRWGSENSECFHPLPSSARVVLRGLCRLLLDRGREVHKASQTRFVERLGHTLRGRRRLEPTKDELLEIAQYLAQEAGVRAELPTLMMDLLPLYSHSEIR